MKKIRTLTIVALLVAAVSCTPSDMKEDTPTLVCEDCTLPADVEQGIVSAQIPVSSNQSWTARIEGVCSWASISDEEHINPSSVTDNGWFTVSLDDNDAYDSRSFNVTVTGRYLSRTLTITQQSKKNRLRVVESLSQTLAPEPDNQTISLLSNTAWRAEVDSTKCILSAVSGYGDEIIEVSFTPNYSFDTVAVTNVLFICENADTVRMTYQLEKNVPFVRVESEKATVLSIDSTAVIPFHANGEWKAEILNSTIEELMADRYEGQAGQQSLGLTFKRNRSESVREATIRLSLVNFPDVYKDVALVQRQGITLFLDFSKGVSKVPLLPATPSDPPLKTKVTDGLAHNYVFTFDGEDYYFTLQFPVEYYYYIGGKCFYSRKGYFLLPSIEGKRLTEIQILANGKRYSVCEDSAGTVPLKGGSIFTTTSGVTARWVLQNTEQSASYFLCFHDNGMQTKTITLIYE